MDNSETFEDIPSDDKPRTEEPSYPDLAGPFAPVPLAPQPAGLEGYEVSIGEPISGQHVTYPISVDLRQGRDGSGSFEAVRRYNDFYAFHECLLIQWPGLVIPQIPPKKLLVLSTQGNKADEVVTYRRHMLEVFLRSCFRLPFLVHSETMTAFLRGQGNFAESTRTMKRRTFKEIATVYTETFPDYSRSGMVADQVISALEGDYEALRLLLSSLKQCQVTASRLTRHFHHLQRTYGRLAASIVTFEDNFLKQLSDEIAPGLFKKWDFESIANPYTVISVWLEAQCGQVQALLEAYDRRRSLCTQREQIKAKALKDTATANKLRAGKNTFSGLISGKSKQTQITILEEQIKQADEAVEALNLIYSVATLRLQDYDLAFLKSMQGAAYEAAMRSFGQAASTAFTTVRLI